MAEWRNHNLAGFEDALEHLVRKIGRVDSYKKSELREYCNRQLSTDQIVTVDTSQRALRHLATVVDEEKLRLVDESLRMMLSL